MVLFCYLLQHQVPPPPLCLLHIQLAGGNCKIKKSVGFPIEPSVEKRKMVHVYYYTDISLVVDSCGFRLGQL